jgi:hypothetical protein
VVLFVAWARQLLSHLPGNRERWGAAMCRYPVAVCLALCRLSQSCFPPIVCKLLLCVMGGGLGMC